MEGTHFPHTQTSIEADTSDTDSALGDDLSSYTASLKSSLLQSVRENGRGYHRYLASSGKDYVIPDDEEEQDRLDLQHHIFRKTFHERLYLCPLSSPAEVLDLGTGTGAWAIDFADENPSSFVTGTDLSPIQPSMVPPNCRFIVDDFENQWIFQKRFDFIHARILAGSVSSFPALFSKAYDALNPGGWFEIQDICVPLGSDDDSLPKDSAYARWTEMFMEGLEKGLNRNWGWATEYKRWLTEAGFEAVEQFVFKWPINTWPKDPKMKEIGGLNLVNTSSGLEGL
jgi:SAM-dependent methyltransferase